MNESNHNPLSIKVMKLLAENLGVEAEDISEDDSFTQDLHMAPDKLADFAETLSASGFEISNLALGELETVGDLTEALSSHEDIK